MASAGMEKEARLVVVKHKETFEITSIYYVLLISYPLAKLYKNY